MGGIFFSTPFFYLSQIGVSKQSNQSELTLFCLDYYLVSAVREDLPLIDFPKLHVNCSYLFHNNKQAKALFSVKPIVTYLLELVHSIWETFISHILDVLEPVKLKARLAESVAEFPRLM